MVDFSADSVTTQLFIGGAPRQTTSTTTVYDPARPSVIVGLAAAAAPDDVEAGIRAATEAYPAWSALTPRQRADALRDASDTLASHRDDDAALLTREIGKPVHESVVDSIVLEARWKLALDLVDSVEYSYELPALSPDQVPTEVMTTPLGVVTIIVPFNWPLAILGAALPHALLAGNTVIVKPPRTAPLATARAIARVAAQLPPGVLNVITGDDDQVRPLIDDSRIAKVCFTGSVEGGKRIMQLASRSLTRLTLELGGNDPAIVLADAPLDDEHLDRMFAAIFDTSGQICMNIKRIYVHESRRDELVSALSARLERVRIGHGLDPEVTMGPLHSRPHLTWLSSLVNQARDSGAQVIEFGEIPTGDLSDGHFMRPTLVIDPTPELDVVTQEQFGPVIPILTFTHEADALAAANDTWAGLGASVWTTSPESADRLARRLHCGYVWINDHGAPRLDLRAPFGGMKQSGFGREQGVEGIRSFQDTRVVSR